MKKLILMLLLVVGGVNVASAWDNIYLRAEGHWNDNEGLKFSKVDNNNFYVEISTSSISDNGFYFRFDHADTNGKGVCAPANDGDVISSTYYKNVWTYQTGENLHAFKINKDSRAQRVFIYLNYYTDNNTDYNWQVKLVTLYDQYTVKNSSKSRAYVYDANGIVLNGVWPGNVLTNNEATFYAAEGSKIVFNNGGDDSKTVDLPLVYNGVYDTDLIGVMAKVSNAGYATFSSLCALSIPADGAITAYRADRIENGEIIFKKVSGNIPANTGLLLKSNGEANMTFNIVDSGEPVGTNMMVATPSATTVSASASSAYNYFLSSGNNEVGFYNLAADATSGAGKAYLHTTEELTKVQNARASWSFEDDTTTGIDAVKSEKQSNEIYNLNGQRVNNAVRGLYIVNGKKVIMK